MKIKRILRVVSLILFFSIINYGQTDQPIQENPEVSEITIDELNDKIKNREGRVLLINIWATWCVPCKEEFPDMIKISDKYGEKIEVVGISIDYPDEVESKIIPFLNKLKPNFINYVNGENDTERFINNLRPDWSGAIPATFFYDSEGKQFLFYEVKMSFKEIEKKVIVKVIEYCDGNVVKAAKLLKISKSYIYNLHFAVKKKKISNILENIEENRKDLIISSNNSKRLNEIYSVLESKFNKDSKKIRKLEDEFAETESVSLKKYNSYERKIEGLIDSVSEHTNYIKNHNSKILDINENIDSYMTKTAVFGTGIRAVM